MIEVHHIPVKNAAAVRTRLGLKLSDRLFLGPHIRGCACDLLFMVLSIPLSLVREDALFTKTLQFPGRPVLHIELRERPPFLACCTSVLPNVSRYVRTRPLPMPRISTDATDFDPHRSGRTRLFSVPLKPANAALLSHITVLASKV